MQRALPLFNGWCHGPLFGPAAKTPAPLNVGTRMPGIRRRARERKHTPSWADPTATARKYAEAERLTRTTGVVHSVDHIVPLHGGGMVCGLHWHGNMEVKPLAENLSKGTRWWPCMWEQQAELFNA